jgi:hypothetical protein
MSLSPQGSWQSDPACYACGETGGGGMLTWCRWEPPFTLRLCWTCTFRLSKKEQQQARAAAWQRFTAEHPRAEKE